MYNIERKEMGTGTIMQGGHEPLIDSVNESPCRKFSHLSKKGRLNRAKINTLKKMLDNF